MPLRIFNRDDAENHPLIIQAIERSFFIIRDNRITYDFGNHKKSYDWTDPEEWVRAYCIAFLIFEKGYPTNRIQTEVKVPRRTPSDFADIVVYGDDACKTPYLIVECKSSGQSSGSQNQHIEQLFGNANSLRASIGLYDEYDESIFYDIANFPSTERIHNRKGNRDNLPSIYGETPKYSYIAGSDNDIKPAIPKSLNVKLKRAHGEIWSGGKRDPLSAFDEWSKLLFAKVEDERTTPNGKPRLFQIGTSETTSIVANRVIQLYKKACKRDPSIFPENAKIDLSDSKIYEVVSILEDVSITDTSADTIGSAFESFFGSVFRGQLGQYFTMRPIARFTVGMLDITHEDYVIDPTAGSGGFLLETLLQVWHKLDRAFSGRDELWRLKDDFAKLKVYGIEIHEILARICKINLLLHHDGHTNIEGDRSCLDNHFSLPRLSEWNSKFSKIVGNPPFGDEIKEGDSDQLGGNSLQNFELSKGKSKEKVDSEHLILERSIEMLEPGGTLGLVLPDGLLNNQGEGSNCPRVRRYLAKNGRFVAIVSLPDYAFRKSGAQNKTSLLFYRKFTQQEKRNFDSNLKQETLKNLSEGKAIGETLKKLDYNVFLAEARVIGYTPSGSPSILNELYDSEENGRISEVQVNSILGEFRNFQKNPCKYNGHREPDCLSIKASDMWNSHSSNRIDPKYFIFKSQELTTVPEGWVSARITDVMRRRNSKVKPEEQPDEHVKVLTISQTGAIRLREAGKGINPPEWLGIYFENSSSTWFQATKEDVVYSSIDLWKGCIAVVSEEFDGGLVTKEFPIYEVIDERLDPEFLSVLLRTRYYQRAFRAITTGHSNRRRTQQEDFEALEIVFPKDKEEQRNLVSTILDAYKKIKSSNQQLVDEMSKFSNIIDGRENLDYFFNEDIDENDAITKE